MFAKENTGLSIFLCLRCCSPMTSRGTLKRDEREVDGETHRPLRLGPRQRATGWF